MSAGRPGPYPPARRTPRRGGMSKVGAHVGREGRYGLMMALVPIGTSGYSSSESEINIRMQPWEA